MKRKILALILAAAMIFSTLPVFADDTFGKVEKEYAVNGWTVGTAANPLTVSGGNDGKIDYVSLGDSMAFGYGLPAMGKGKHNKAFVEVQGSYPDLIRDYLASKYAKKYSFFQGAVSGARALDDCIFLSDNFKSDSYHDAYFKKQYFYESGNDGYEADKNDYNAFTTALPENVKNADFITITVGGNDTLLYSVLALLGPVLNGGDIRDNPVSKDNLEQFYGASAVSKYTAMKEKLLGIIGESGKSKIEPIFNAIEVILYSMGSVVKCEPELLDIIHEENPGAVIALTGLPAILSEYKVQVDNVTVDLGSIFAPMSNVLNAYVKNIAEERSSYVRYIDIFDFDPIPVDVDPEVAEDGVIKGEKFVDFLTEYFLKLTHPSELGQKQIADSIMKNFNFSVRGGKLAVTKNYVKNVYTMFLSKIGISKIENVWTAVKRVNFLDLLSNSVSLVKTIASIAAGLVN